MMETKKARSKIQIQNVEDVATSIKGGTPPSIGRAKVMYKQPEIYMVPLHEISEIAQEDWFLESVNVIAGILLGVALERIITKPELAWIILLTISTLIVIYRLLRRYKQDKEIAKIKDKAIPFEISEQS